MFTFPTLDRHLNSPDLVRACGRLVLWLCSRHARADLVHIIPGLRIVRRRERKVKKGMISNLEIKSFVNIF